MSGDQHDVGIVDTMSTMPRKLIQVFRILVRIQCTPMSPVSTVDAQETAYTVKGEETNMRD